MVHLLTSLLVVFSACSVVFSQIYPNVSNICSKGDLCSCQYANFTNNRQVTLSCYSQYICPYNSAAGVYCSGHGTCDFASSKCICEIDYGKTDCSKAYTVFWLTVPAQFSIIAIGSILGLISLGLIVWTHLYRNVREVKAMSVVFTHITLFGNALICVHSIIVGLGWNNVTCVLVEWFGFIGITLVSGSAMLKAYRISSIFNKVMSSPLDLTDKKLGKYLVAMLCTILVLLSVYTVINFHNGGAYTRYVAASLQKEPRCNGEFTTFTMYGILILFELVLLIGVIAFGNKTRSAGEIFKETRCIYVGSNISTILLITFGIFITFTTQLNWQMMIRGFGSQVVAAMVLYLLFKPKFQAVYGQPPEYDNDGLTDKDRVFKKNFELSLKDRTGRELVAMLECIVGEVSYRKGMNMIQIELHEKDAQRIERILQETSELIREEERLSAAHAPHTDINLTQTVQSSTENQHYNSVAAGNGSP